MSWPSTLLPLHPSRTPRVSTVTASHVIKNEAQRADISKRTTSHFNVKADAREEDGDRAFKKRRSSSDIPNEAKLFEEQDDHDTQVAASLHAGVNTEPEADPNGTEWDDLDADDGDDPLMVSEYVMEIFNYKNVEVAINHVDHPQPTHSSSLTALLAPRTGLHV